MNRMAVRQDSPVYLINSKYRGRCSGLMISVLGRVVQSPIKLNQG